MKALTIALFAFAASSPALADRAGPDWIGIERVAAIAKEAGYVQVSKIEADDGRWEVEAIKDGLRFKFNVDPRSGAITDQRRDD